MKIHNKFPTGFTVPGGSRTHGLSLRRRTLYPTELRRHFTRLFYYIHLKKARILLRLLSCNIYNLFDIFSFTNYNKITSQNFLFFTHNKKVSYAHLREPRLRSKNFLVRGSVHPSRSVLFCKKFEELSYRIKKCSSNTLAMYNILKKAHFFRALACCVATNSSLRAVHKFFI